MCGSEQWGERECPCLTSVSYKKISKKGPKRPNLNLSETSDSLSLKRLQKIVLTLLFFMICRRSKKRRHGGGASSSSKACLFRGSQHCPELLDELDCLRGLQGSGGLVDLDIICQDKKIRVHKVVMAAASQFFKVSTYYFKYYH